MKDAVQRSVVCLHHGKPVDDMIHASAFVVKSVTSPGQRIEWLAKLGGLTVVSSEYAMGSANGPWIQFKGVSELPPVRHFLLDRYFRENLGGLVIRQADIL